MKSTITILTSLVLLGGATAQAQTLLNGDFELTASSNQVNTGAQSWTSTGTATRWLAGLRFSSVPIADTGNAGYVLALPDSDSSISQDITGLTNLQQYEVSFDYTLVTVNGDATDWSFDLDVRIDGVDQLNIVGNRSDLDADLGGTGFPTIASTSFTFAADATTTASLQFASNITSTGNGQGIAIDNVVITAVPEPSAFALIGGALALGFAGTRRRRS